MTWKPDDPGVSTYDKTKLTVLSPEKRAVAQLRGAEFGTTEAAVIRELLRRSKLLSAYVAAVTQQRVTARFRQRRLNELLTALDNRCGTPTKNQPQT